MEINLSRVRKFWAISFWLLLGWSLINIGFEASTIEAQGMLFLLGKLAGTVFMMGSVYACAYKEKGVHSLVYLMTVASLSIFGDLMEKANYDVAGMILKGFIWFTSYRLLLANAALRCKIKPENKEAEVCDIT
jgi:hypothetical protein